MRPVEERRPLRRQLNDHNFGSLLMLAVTADLAQPMQKHPWNIAEVNCLTPVSGTHHLAHKGRAAFGQRPPSKTIETWISKGDYLHPAEQPPVVEEPEARRIAGELLKLQKDGAITAPMTRMPVSMPLSCTPSAGPTSGESPLNSQRIIVDSREPWRDFEARPIGLSPSQRLPLGVGTIHPCR